MAKALATATETETETETETVSRERELFDRLSAPERGAMVLATQISVGLSLHDTGSGTPS